MVLHFENTPAEAPNPKRYKRLHQTFACRVPALPFDSQDPFVLRRVVRSP
jgi:hypothetical protein